MIFWLRNTNFSSQLHAIAGRIVYCAVTSKSAICGIAGENRPTGAKFPMEIIDL